MKKVLLKEKLNNTQEALFGINVVNAPVHVHARMYINDNGKLAEEIKKTIEASLKDSGCLAYSFFPMTQINKYWVYKMSESFLTEADSDHPYEKKTGLFGVITGTIGFIVTIIYTVFISYIFNNDNNGVKKLFPNGAYIKIMDILFNYC